MLHIPFTYLDPSSLIFMAQQCPKLKYLNLAGTLISDDCLEDLIEVAKNLRGINLSYNNDLSVECFERFKNLEEFEFDKFNLNCLLAIAKNCKNSIRKLTIECENDLNLGDLLIFENLTHLTLTAEDFTPANTADWIFLTSNLKNLKKLSVSTQRDLIIDDVLITIMKNNDSLETLQFEESLLTDKSVSKAPLFCKNLSWLSIRSSQHITDESLKALTSLKKLTHLCIERSKISDEGVFMILRAFPMLGRLNVASCSQVTTKVVEFAYDLMQANRLNRDIVIDCKVGIIKLNRYPSKEVLRSVCNPEDHKCDNKNCLTSSFKFCFEENKDPCTIG